MLCPFDSPPFSLKYPIARLFRGISDLQTCLTEKWCGIVRAIHAKHYSAVHSTVQPPAYLLHYHFHFSYYTFFLFEMSAPQIYASANSNNRYAPCGTGKLSKRFQLPVHFFF